MIANQSLGAHSAQVEMQLIINGESISITHMGPDFLIVESPREHPPGEATSSCRWATASVVGPCSCPMAFIRARNAFQFPNSI